MMIRCSRHGLQRVVVVSPDYDESDGRRFDERKWVFEYRIESDLAFRALLSPEYAASVGARAGSFELPDEMPAWESHLRATCYVCYTAAKGGGAKPSSIRRLFPLRPAVTRRV